MTHEPVNKTSRFMKKQSILLIYTGGTIGMKEDPETQALKPFNFEQIQDEVPEIRKFGCEIDSVSFNPLIDSSDVEPSFWVKLCKTIQENYDRYDGFVVLHGTDTMSYSASALSFMLENLEKPVIFTGSQLPIGMLRTDGKENLISSIEIACARREDGHAMVPEVCIFFDSQLFRGNRTTKYSSENFRAFKSANLPPLAEAGIHIKYNKKIIIYPETWGKKLEIKTTLNTSVAVMKLFPGITDSIMEAILYNPEIKSVIIETYGAGNAPTSQGFLSKIKRSADMGKIIVNVTQCQAGSVNMGTYEAGLYLEKAGVISGHDITIEAAIAKLFFLTGYTSDFKEIKYLMSRNLRGEITLE